jgi:hypothetical protein
MGKQERYNPQNPCPPVIITHQAAYDTIGYILDNQVIILSPEKVSLFSSFFLPSQTNLSLAKT